jgi:hypothetical protein
VANERAIQSPARAALDPKINAAVGKQIYYSKYAAFQNAFFPFRPPEKLFYHD